MRETNSGKQRDKIVTSLPPRKIVMHDAHGLLGDTPGWRIFHDPVKVIQAANLEEVADALRRVELAAGEGYTATGFISYEASPSFDTALHARRGGELPLIWFALYDKWSTYELPAITEERAYSVSSWRPAITRNRYVAEVRRIKELIACGETYQVNHTFRLSADFQGDAWAFFLKLQDAKQSKYGAYLDIGNDVICSVSPELFLLRKGRKLTCRPMKGTVGRGLGYRDDESKAEWLRSSEKNRAENVMIVDMMRNDLGKIAELGTVDAESLFDVERFATLWQMTSTVTAECDSSLCAILAALFPCASITGAPKVQASRIIAGLESTHRGVYTGCVGFIAPGGDAQFNVAIRTVHLNRRKGRMTYGTGGGITWDSDPDEEYVECLTKTLALTADYPSFKLLETILWKPVSGYFLIEGHMRRLEESARYFEIPLDMRKVSECLQNLALNFPPVSQRVRLLAQCDGTLHVEAQPLTYARPRRRRVLLAKRPISIDNRFLYHKTTMREHFRLALEEAPTADDVLLWNMRREITETTIGNVVVKLCGAFHTPPVSCGLLPGVYREQLLEKGRVTERVISIEDMLQAETIYVVNSVRGWMPVERSMLLESIRFLGEESNRQERYSIRGFPKK